MIVYYHIKYYMLTRQLFIHFVLIYRSQVSRFKQNIMSCN